MSTDFHSKFEEGLFYHVYNRTNNNEFLFKNDRNFIYFLKRFEHFLKDSVDLVAYCLMPTHFHFIVHPKIGTISSSIEDQFRKFFISYSKAYNKMYKRHGNLLNRPFKRVIIDSEFKLIEKICYVHHNPIHHGYCENYSEWKYSTFNNYIQVHNNNLLQLKLKISNLSNEQWIQKHTDYKENYNIDLNHNDDFEEN